MKIALFKGNGFISKLIRWQTRGMYSHAALILNDGTVVESREFVGVRHVPDIIRDKGEEVDIFAIDTTPAQDSTIAAFALEQVGKKYNYVGVFRFLTRQRWSASERDKWFCSELVYSAFKHAGLSLFRETEAWEVDPEFLSRSSALKIHSQLR